MGKYDFAIERPRRINIEIEGYDALQRLRLRKRQRRRMKLQESSGAGPVEANAAPVAGSVAELESAAKAHLDSAADQ